MSKSLRLSVQSFENVCAHSRRHLGATALWQQCNLAESMPIWLICDTMSASVALGWMILRLAERKHCHIGSCGNGGPQPPVSKASIISCVVSPVSSTDLHVSRHIGDREYPQHGKSEGKWQCRRKSLRLTASPTPKNTYIAVNCRWAWDQSPASRNSAPSSWYCCHCKRVQLDAVAPWWPWSDFGIYCDRPATHGIKEKWKWIRNLHFAFFGTNL